MFTVGFGGSIHDYSTAVADEISVRLAVEDERVTRDRYALHSKDPLRASFEYCVNAIPEIQHSAVKKGANDTLAHCPLLATVSPVWMNHHFTHAASSFYTSPFDEAMIVVADGAGSVSCDFDDWHSRETTSLFYGRGNTIELVASVDGRKQCRALQNDFDHFTDDSIGDLYEAVTCAIGFSPLQEGKTMALAAYGDDRFVRDFGQRIRSNDGFSFSVDLTGRDGLLRYMQKVSAAYEPSEGKVLPFDVGAALAYAAQHQVERLLRGLLGAAKQLGKSDNLCFAGGVGLNAVAMGKLPELGDFGSVHLISAPGDGGTSIGAALALQVESHSRTNAKRWPWTPYLGKTYEIHRQALAGLVVRECPTDEAILSLICEAVLGGKIVALFRGRSEFGPRALGHRSLVASPLETGIQSRMNRLKSREWFRPVAPMTITHGHEGLRAAERWMQVARQNVGGVLGTRAALHVDGTARVQLVDDEADPFLRHLLSMLQAHGVSALLNTSFNLRAQPIVETPGDAIEAFVSAPIDVLAIERFFVTKPGATCASATA